MSPTEGNVHTVVMRQYGPPEVLTYTQVSLPPLGSDEVRIRSIASAVNHTDLEIRAGNWPLTAAKFCSVVRRARPVATAQSAEGSSGTGAVPGLSRMPSPPYGAFVERELDVGRWGGSEDVRDRRPGTGRWKSFLCRLEPVQQFLSPAQEGHTSGRIARPHGPASRRDPVRSSDGRRDWRTRWTWGR
jgi:hypothetical protein